MSGPHGVRPTDRERRLLRVIQDYLRGRLRPQERPGGDDGSEAGLISAHQGIGTGKALAGHLATARAGAQGGSR